MVDWSIILCANNHITGNGTGTGRRTVTSYWFTANSFAHELEGSYESYQRFPLYTPRPHNWQREGLPCVRHEAFCLWFCACRSAWYRSTWSNGIFERISNHRGKLSQRKSLQFFVSWMGYDQSYYSWEPFANLRDSDHLHSYLRQKNFTQLIPTKFR